MRADQYKTSGLMIQLSNALIWFRNRELQRNDLTSSQFEVIRYLLTHQGQDVTASTIMAQLGLSQSTIAGILKRLHTKGLIQRRTDQSDARREFLILTEKGLALEASLQSIACKTEEILLRGMSQPEQEAFYRLLHLALENMNAVRTGEENRSHG